MLFLFSCGTISNDGFKKRKHLKGWHFQKQGNLTKSSTHEKAKNQFNEENQIDESTLTFRQTKKINESKIKESNAQILLEEVDESGQIDNEENSTKNSRDLSKKELSSSNIITNKGIQEVFSNRIFEDSEQIVNNRVEDEPVAEENPRINSPWMIVLKTLGLIYAVGLAMFLVLFIGLTFINVNLVIIGLPILVIGIYLGLSFLVYYFLRLLRRTDGKEIWSLKKTLLWGGIIYTVIGAVVYPLIFKEIL